MSAEAPTSLAIERIRPDPVMGMREMLAAIEAMAAGPRRRVLIDVRGFAQLGNTENVLLSHQLALHLRGVRVAVLVDEVTGDGEAVARRMGADMRAFEEECAALAWLQR